MSSDELLEGAARFLHLFEEEVLPRPGEAQRLQRLLFRRLGDDRPGMNGMRYFPDCNGGWWVNLTELAQELSLMDPQELAEATKSEWLWLGLWQWLGPWQWQGQWHGQGLGPGPGLLCAAVGTA